MSKYTFFVLFALLISSGCVSCSDDDMPDPIEDKTVFNESAAHQIFINQRIPELKEKVADLQQQLEQDPNNQNLQGELMAAEADLDNQAAWDEEVDEDIEIEIEIPVPPGPVPCSDPNNGCVDFPTGILKVLIEPGTKLDQYNIYSGDMLVFQLNGDSETVGGGYRTEALKMVNSIEPGTSGRIEVMKRNGSLSDTRIQNVDFVQ